LKKSTKEILSNLTEIQRRNVAIIRLAFQGVYEPYIKMMHNYRPGRGVLVEIIKLKKEYKKNGFNTFDNPITLNSSYSLIDGFHRVAYASLNQIKELDYLIEDIIVNKNDYFDLGDYKNIVEKETKKF
jgi:hypothetical protein